MKQDIDFIAYKAYARLTGILYLVIIVCAGFSQGAVREVLVVWGDGASTANNISDNLIYFKAGIITDLIAFMCDIGVSILLYCLLAPAGKVLSLAAAAFRLIAHPAIGSLNLLNHYAAARVIESPDLAASFSAAGLQELPLFFMELHYVGYLVAGALFGIHCLLLGVLLYRSAHFPAWLGVLLSFSAAGYLIESFGYILVPEFKSTFALIVGVTAVLGEVSLTIWLLVKSVRNTSSETSSY